MDSKTKIILSRHGEKEPMPGTEKPADMVPGDGYDKYFIVITPKSGKKLTKEGKETLGEKEYDKVYNITSDFIRAMQSAHYFSSDINIAPGGLIYAAPDPLLSFVANPKADWTRKELDGLGQDDLIKYLFENEYFTDSENPTTIQMALMSQKYMQSVIVGIEHIRANNNKDRRNALLHFTHAPPIDTFGAQILGYLNVDEKHKVVEVNDNYKGAINMGEMFVGNIARLTSDNPVLQLDIQGLEKEVTLNELNKINDKLIQHAYHM